MEFDHGTVFWYRARLIVNDEVVDENSVFWGTTRLRAPRPGSFVVDATAGFLGPKKVVLRDGARTIPFAKDK
ncbi:hypothetical protein [Aeromicrobium phragmitis]|uniref:hypothetical protein n=1 Tax=Aeromicrobium phragmitis TaxID=2478914 RepID=UPI00105C3619|nr:hypothetical protein [Aeromicrobium phragmitis]